MRKKILGYMFKTREESFRDIFEMEDFNTLFKNKKEVEKAIKEARNNCWLGKKETVKILKFVMEEV